MKNRKDIRRKGMRLAEIKPSIIGGDPADLDNKTWVTKEEHFELVRYWNAVIYRMTNTS